MDAGRKEERGGEGFKMNFKIIEKTKNNLVLELSDTTEAEINTLRRLIVSEVPTLAIHEVEFLKNDSALFDEVLANRLGLIPIKTDLKSYTEVGEKKRGKVITQVEFKLKSVGPCIVYSGDLKSTDEKVKPVFDDIPLVKLLEGQKLELHAMAVLGRGKQHMKFSPGAVYYHHKPILKINNDSKKLEQFKDKFPKQAFKDGKLNEQSLLKDNLYEACEDIDQDLLKVDYDKSKFIFYFESFGQLEIIESIIVALEKFNEKIDELEKKLKGANSPEKVIKDAVKVAKKVTNLKK